VLLLTASHEFLSDYDVDTVTRFLREWGVANERRAPGHHPLSPTLRCRPFGSTNVGRGSQPAGAYARTAMRTSLRFTT
jgi:hypothetical protein